MTPIREEESESTMSANAATPIVKEEADVNIKKGADTTTPVGEEEFKTSSSASTIVPTQKEEANKRGMVVIGYFYQVPSVKWHPNFEMMSKAGLSQGQYERIILAQGYVDNFDYLACPLRFHQFLYHHNFTSSSSCLCDE